MAVQDRARRLLARNRIQTQQRRATMLERSSQEVVTMQSGSDQPQEMR